MMEKKTFIIKTGDQSGCLKTKAFGADSIDDISFHKPETVIEFDGWKDHLYTKAACDDAREFGQKEAWGLAQKIVDPEDDGGFTLKELDSIFGTHHLVPILRNHTYDEATKKVKDWEEETKVINVGDIVKLEWAGITHRAVVSRVSPDLLSVMLDDGNVDDVARSRCTKTGDALAAEFSAVLKKLKGEE